MPPRRRVPRCSWLAHGWFGSALTDAPGRAGAQPVAAAEGPAGGHDGQMGAGGYESWFVSARDPVSPRALWIRHTRHRPRAGRESVALWCTVIDRDGGRQPTVIKEVLGAFPPGTAAGPGQFRGQATMAEHRARWDLAVTGDQAPLRPLRPPALYRAPLPRTKLEAVVPDGQVTGSLELDGRTVAV